MALLTGTISGKILRPDLGGSGCSVTIHAQTDGTRLAYAGKIIAGKIPVPVRTDGTARVTLPLVPQTGLTPVGALWRVTFKTSYGVDHWDFTLSGDTTWDQIVDVSNVPVTSSIQAAAEAARDAAIAAVASVKIGTWQPTTAYVTDQAVQAPDGSLIKSGSSRTSRASFDATEATNWTAIEGKAGSISQKAVVDQGVKVARPAPAIDILGDSITAQNGGTTPSGTQPSGATYGASSSPSGRGYLYHAVTLLGHRARAGTNFGIGGQTSTQILSRVPDVLASPNPFCHVYAGINDVAATVSATTIKQNLLSIYQQLRAAGKVVTTSTIGTSIFISGAAITNAGGISVGATSCTANAGASIGDVLTLGPGTANVENVTVTSSTGSGPYTIGFAATTKTHAQGDLIRNTTRLAILHDVNQWVIDYCRGRYVDPTSGLVVTGGTEGIYLVDWHSLVADPNTGQPYGALDGTGAIIGVATNPLTFTVDGTHPGQDLAHRMGHALAVVLDRLLPPLPIRNGDNSETGNLITNGRAVGNSSGLATGWTLTATAGSLTATPSKVARTDGVPGEAQQIAIGPGNTGQGAALVGDTSGLTFSGTDAYVLEVEFETDNNLVIQTSPAGGSVTVGAILTFRNAGGVVATGYSHFTSSGTDGASSLWDSSGLLRTERVTPAATATRVQAQVIFQGIDTGTLRIKSARVRKVVA